jgi:hypothetical protein
MRLSTQGQTLLFLYLRRRLYVLRFLVGRPNSVSKHCRLRLGGNHPRLPHPLLRLLTLYSGYCLGLLSYVLPRIVKKMWFARGGARRYMICSKWLRGGVDRNSLINHVLFAVVADQTRQKNWCKRSSAISSVSSLSCKASKNRSLYLLSYYHITLVNRLTYV